MSTLLSIIIPVFNVEKYIKKCLDSIFDQTSPEDLFEVIVVNDGTLDGSMEIVKSYKQIHSNIKIYNKTNGGVSTARNVGISIAQGDYLIFVDPDDTLCYNALANVKAVLKNETSDIFVLRSFSNQRENYQWKSIFEEDLIYTGAQLLKKNYIRGSVCGCVINRSFLKSNNILFPEGVVNFEDTIFMMLCMCYTQNIRFVNIDLYKVFIREGSASTSITRDRVIRMVKGLEFIEQYRQIHRLNTLQQSILEYLKYSIISNATLYSIRCREMKYKEFVTQTRIKRYLPIKSNLVQQQLGKIRILNLSFWLYYILIYIKNRE